MSQAPRELREVPVAPGPAGVRAVRAALAAAISGGPAVAPVPASHDPDGSDELYSSRIRAALRPDDPDAPLERDDIVAVVATSGSTGDPKGVLLTDDAIRSAAAGTEALLGGPGDWVVAMPVHGVGGLMVVARSILSGTALHPDPSVGGAQSFQPEVFADTVARARAVVGTGRLYCSLVPTQLQRLLDAGSVGVTALQAFDAVLSGAAATPGAMVDTLRRNGIRLHVSYGMSETCGGCAYDGVPLPGVQITTESADGQARGRLQVSGAQVAAGYRCRTHPDLRDGQFLTGDLGTVDADGLVSVRGRIDDIVVVGGANVELPAIEDVLRSVTGVQDACVVAVPDDTWGARLVAYVVTREPMPSADSLRAPVRVQLGRAAVPRSYVTNTDAPGLLAAGIPLLPTGKPDRALLRTDATRR